MNKGKEEGSFDSFSSSMVVHEAGFIPCTKVFTGSLY